MHSPVKNAFVDSSEEVDRALQKAQLEYYRALEKERNSSIWSKIFTLEYLKEISPSVVLAVIAILALSASATAQHSINDVNASLVAAQNQLLTAQGNINSMQQQLDTAQRAAEAALAAANQTYSTALQIQVTAAQFAQQKLNEANTILARISAINASYPYPWAVEARMTQEEQLTAVHNTKLDDIHRAALAYSFLQLGTADSLSVAVNAVVRTNSIIVSNPPTGGNLDHNPNTFITTISCPSWWPHSSCRFQLNAVVAALLAAQSNTNYVQVQFRNIDAGSSFGSNAYVTAGTLNPTGTTTAVGYVNLNPGSSAQYQLVVIGVSGAASIAGGFSTVSIIQLA